MARTSPRHAGYQRLIRSSRRSRPCSTRRKPRARSGDLGDAVERDRRPRRDRPRRMQNCRTDGAGPLASIRKYDCCRLAGDARVNHLGSKARVERSCQPRGQPSTVRGRRPGRLLATTRPQGHAHHNDSRHTTRHTTTLRRSPTAVQASFDSPTRPDGPKPLDKHIGRPPSSACGSARRRYRRCTAPRRTLLKLVCRSSNLALDRVPAALPRCPVPDRGELTCDISRRSRPAAART